jgi:preprotein translocase subunit SecA
MLRSGSPTGTAGTATATATVMATAAASATPTALSPRTAPASGVFRSGGSLATGAAAAGSQARPGFTPSGAKIGRNDACWCGSGLKYKKCHGR